jgi:predicted nuclease of predicted toxin-antitoxin system
MTAGWRFLVDENLHPQIVTYLRKENIDASYVPDVLFE